ncbi:hypothetical protein L3Y34_011194 [Caenorhabditis briggsae]|uniref:Uncharacterized protein n=2 Tax=Caenorhabditis briggsae TaxID=6238 RepID=A0AAE9CTN7_CAEBR|nr:hypothetical protein L3Y34_011194 [Caenorhabditis briggsae]
MAEKKVLLPPSDNVKMYSNFIRFLFVIWECTTNLEKCLSMFALFFAICSGICQPIMNQNYGIVSQTFSKITSAMNNETLDNSDLNTSFEDFQSDMNAVTIRFLLGGCALFIFGFFQFSLFKYVGDNTTYRIRSKLIHKLLHKDAKFFDTVSTGQLSAVLNDNMDRFREVFNEKLATIIHLSTNVFLGTTLAFYTDWKLASYGLFFAVGLAFSGLINSTSMMGASKAQSYHYANAGGIAYQALSCFKTVISLNGQSYELKSYSSELKLGEKHGIHRALLFATSRAVTNFFCSALNGTLLYIGAGLIYNKTMDQASIVTLFHYMMLSAYSLAEVLPHISNLLNAISSASSIFEILTSNDDNIENEDVPDDQKPINGVIQFKDVRFSYPTRPNAKVLKGISLEVKRGECVALVGASGSGKSTLVQLLLRHYNKDSGSISIDGVELENISLKKLRRNIGVVSQEPILFDTTIEQNIRFGNPECSKFEIFDALKKANAYEFVASFPNGIETIVGEGGAQLSGGQKQRIAIARVLVKNPKILLLDEATSALDNESEREIQKALRKASEGRTTIIIAHRLSTINNCDKIIVMSQGQIIESGAHKDLIQKAGAYNNLINSQIFDSEEKQTSQKDPLDINKIKENSNSLRKSSKGSQASLTDTPEEKEVSSGFWEIINECRPQYFWLLTAIIGSFMQGLSPPLLAQLIVRTYKAYSMEGEDILIYGHFWASMFFALGLIRPITAYTTHYCYGRVAEKLSTRLRIKSFHHMLSLPCAFYDESKNSPTRLANRLNTDASNVKGAVDSRLGTIFTTLVSFLVSISVASYYSWKLTIQIILFFPILYFGKRCYDNATVQSVKQDSALIEKSNKIAVEVLNNIKTVRSLNMGDKVMSMIIGELEVLRKKYRWKAITLGLANGFSVICHYFFYAASFKFGTHLILQREILPMNMYVSFITLSYTSNMVGNVMLYLPEYRKAVHAAGLIFNLLKTPATMPYDSKEGSMEIKNGVVKGSNISFHYHQRLDHMVLKNVNLSLKPGKTLALVGPSGSGKSSFISLIERFYQVDTGCVKIDNEDVEDINIHHLRSNLGLVAQEPVLFNCSIRQNLLYGLEELVEEIKIEKALRTANALDFIQKFPEGLNTIVGEHGAQLSGGQKQRIAIARAILRNPKILLLDEATSALDSDSEKLVQNALDTAIERLSTVVVAHRLSTIVNADSIAVFENGQVVEQGTHQELLHRKRAYWRLIQKQEK